ncbi:hypothetical protein BMR07_06860, partial [Methylococcaceae bacterium CS1]
WGAEGISGRVKFLPLAWAGMPKTSFRKNSDSPLNIDISVKWGAIQGNAELQGKPMPAIDGLIAVSGLVHNCIVVTRNVSDMEQSTVELLNPWIKNR